MIPYVITRLERVNISQSHDNVFSRKCSFLFYSAGKKLTNSSKFVIKILHETCYKLELICMTINIILITSMLIIKLIFQYLHIFTRLYIHITRFYVRCLFYGFSGIFLCYRLISFSDMFIKFIITYLNTFPELRV